MYPAAGMDFLAGVFYPDGHGYGKQYPAGACPLPSLSINHAIEGFIIAP
jgi:hypothetical protein